MFSNNAVAITINMEVINNFDWLIKENKDNRIVLNKYGKENGNHFDNQDFIIKQEEFLFSNHHQNELLYADENDNSREFKRFVIFTNNNITKRRISKNESKSYMD